MPQQFFFFLQCCGIEVEMSDLSLFNSGFTFGHWMCRLRTSPTRMEYIHVLHDKTGSTPHCLHIWDRTAFAGHHSTVPLESTLPRRIDHMPSPLLHSKNSESYSHNRRTGVSKAPSRLKLPTHSTLCVGEDFPLKYST